MPTGMTWILKVPPSFPASNDDYKTMV